MSKNDGKLAIYACSGIEESAIGGLGGNYTESELLNKYISEGAEYFLYTYIPDSEVAFYPKRIRDKREKQMKVREYVEAQFVPVYGSRDDFDRFIRQNIVRTINSTEVDGNTIYVDSPEEAIALLRSGVNIGVGELQTAAALIISSVITALLGVVSAVILKYMDIKQQNKLAEIQAKYVVPDEATINSSVPDGSDWSKVNWHEDEKKAGSSWLMWLLVPTALYMLFNPKKK